MSVLSTEIVERRGESHKVFEHPTEKNKKIFQIHCKPIHYIEPSTGNYEDIDCRFVTTGTDYLVEKNKVSVGFRKNGLAEKFIGLRAHNDPAQQFELSLRGAVVDGMSVGGQVFNKVSLDTTNKYLIDHGLTDTFSLHTRVHECFVRSAIKTIYPVTDFSISFEVHLTGFECINDYDKRTKTFSPDAEDRFVFVSTDGTRVWFASPLMWTDTLPPTDTGMEHTLSVSGNKIIYTKTVNDAGRAWLSKADAPMYIDADIYYGATTDGYTQMSDEGSWASAHDTSTPEVKSDSATLYAYGAWTWRTSWYTYYICRSWYWFDTSGIGDSDTIDSADISVYGVTNATGYIVAQASTQNDTYANWTHTAYTGAACSASTASAIGRYAITLNATGIAAINKTGNSKFVLREYTYDFLNTSPTSTTNKACGLTYADYSGTTYDPYLEVTISTGTDYFDTVSFGAEGAGTSLSDTDYKKTHTISGKGAATITSAILSLVSSQSTGMQGTTPAPTPVQTLHKTFSAGAGGTASAADVLDIYKTLSAGAQGTVTAVDILYLCKTISAGSGGTLSVSDVLDLYKTITAGAGGTPTVAAIRIFYAAITEVVQGSASVADVLDLYKTTTVGAVGTSTATGARGLVTAITAAAEGTLTATDVLDVYKTISAGTRGTASVADVLILYKSISTVVQGTATAAEILEYYKTLSGGAEITATIDSAVQILASAATAGAECLSSTTLDFGLPVLFGTRGTVITPGTTLALLKTVSVGAHGTSTENTEFELSQLFGLDATFPDPVFIAIIMASATVSIQAGLTQATKILLDHGAVLEGSSTASDVLALYKEASFGTAVTIPDPGIKNTVATTFAVEVAATAADTLTLVYEITQGMQAYPSIACIRNLISAVTAGAQASGSVSGEFGLSASAAANIIESVITAVDYVQAVTGDVQCTPFAVTAKTLVECTVAATHTTTVSYDLTIAQEVLYGLTLSAVMEYLATVGGGVEYGLSITSAVEYEMELTSTQEYSASTTGETEYTITLTGK